MFQPIAYGSQLYIGGPEASLGVVTCWTVKDRVIEKFGKHVDQVVVGQLYSQERGIDILVRNLLANPQITRLLITGQDLSSSGKALEAFFRSGFREGKTREGRNTWVVEGYPTAYIGADIPKAALDELIFNLDLFVEWELEAAQRFLYEALSWNHEPVRNRYVFEPPKPTAETFPGPEHGYIIRGKTVAEVWAKLLGEILSFGAVVGSSYGQRTQELMDLVTVIEEEDWYNPQLPPWMGLDEEQLDHYTNSQLLNAKAPPGVNYTYGSLMRSHFSRNTNEGGFAYQAEVIDQLAVATEKLRREGEECKSAVVILWDPTIHPFKGGSPCLNQLWFRIRDNKLHLTAVIRSNDMYKAYPSNALGLRGVQEFVRLGLETPFDKLELGPLTIHSESAHLYEDDWEPARAIVEQWLPSRRERFDPKGNFEVRVEDNQIGVRHLSPRGEVLQELSGMRARELMFKLAPFVSDVSHALYLGGELQKAEDALRLGYVYVQDMRLLMKYPPAAPEQVEYADPNTL